MSKISILKIDSTPEGHKSEAQNKQQGKLCSSLGILNVL